MTFMKCCFVYLGSRVFWRGNDHGLISICLDIVNLFVVCRYPSHHIARLVNTIELSPNFIKFGGVQWKWATHYTTITVTIRQTSTLISHWQRSPLSCPVKITSSKGPHTAAVILLLLIGIDMKGSLFPANSQNHNRTKSALRRLWQPLRIYVYFEVHCKLSLSSLHVITQK